MKKHDDFIYVLKYHVVFRSYYNTYTKIFIWLWYPTKKKYLALILSKKIYLAFIWTQKKYLTPNKIQSPPPPLDIKWAAPNVVPIFMKGDHASAANYIPVSLMSICSKLIEHIISSHIIRQLNKYKILHDAQHGFRKKRSCQTQLLLSPNDFLKSLDRNIQTDAIWLYFANAFDKIGR